MSITEYQVQRMGTQTAQHILEPKICLEIDVLILKVKNVDVMLAKFGNVGLQSQT